MYASKFQIELIWRQVFCTTIYTWLMNGTYASGHDHLRKKAMLSTITHIAKETNRTSESECQHLRQLLELKDLYTSPLGQSGQDGNI
jgi:hypothetical protein